MWYFDINGNGVWDAGTDQSFWFGGQTGAVPVVGNWNGGTKSEVGVYVNGIWYLDINGSATWDSGDQTFWFGGQAGAVPVTGTWTGGVQSQLGIYWNGNWYRDVSSTGSWGSTDAAATLWFGGMSGAVPVVGDWNGAGTSNVGIFAGGTWYRDISGTGGWTGADQAATTSFGGSWGIPVTGNWPLSVQGLHAVGPAIAAAPGTMDLTQNALQPIVQAAIARWGAAGASPQILRTMQSTPVVVTDLPGSYLGQFSCGTIYIDQNAAGYGWFVDSTPNQDQEFAAQQGKAQWQAVDPQAVDRADLLTVVEHELGHTAGLADLDASATSLMSGQLPTGVRRDVTPADVDAVFSSAGSHEWL
jgi:hypothetical protein